MSVIPISLVPSSRAETDITQEWDICVPEAQLSAAQSLLDNHPHDKNYERAEPTRPYLSSLRHQFPTYKQKGVRFFFILAPSSACFVDPRPEFCERSHMDIPYPQDVYFVRSLIALQDPADLADMVDAQNLTLEWGNNHLDFPKLKEEAAAFAVKVNDRLKREENFTGGIDVNRDFERHWVRVVEGKDARIEPMKRGRYITRWRARAMPGDPRFPDAKRGVLPRDYV